MSNLNQQQFNTHARRVYAQVRRRAQEEDNLAIFDLDPPVRFKPALTADHPRVNGHLTKGDSIRGLHAKPGVTEDV
jgi:hypothetical protein